MLSILIDGSNRVFKPIMIIIVLVMFLVLFWGYQYSKNVNLSTKNLKRLYVLANVVTVLLNAIYVFEVCFLNVYALMIF